MLHLYNRIFSQQKKKKYTLVGEAVGSSSIRSFKPKFHAFLDCKRWKKEITCKEVFNSCPALSNSTRRVLPGLSTDYFSAKTRQTLPLWNLPAGGEASVL